MSSMGKAGLLFSSDICFPPEVGTASLPVRVPSSYTGARVFVLWPSISVLDAGKRWRKNSDGELKMPGVISNIDREDLFQEICNTLLKWPELERRVFSQAHYHGQSPEAISRSLQLCMEEVNTILSDCDRRLNASIRNFRKNSCEKPLLIPAGTAHSIALRPDLKLNRVQAARGYV
jgi:hypothetical protein